MFLLLPNLKLFEYTPEQPGNNPAGGYAAETTELSQ
jgi:hypothetical protein